MSRVRFPWEEEGEVVSFETPEQTRVEFRVASLGSRALAAMVDRLLILLFALVLFVVALVAIGSGSGFAFDDGGSTIYATLAAIGAVWFLVSTFYFVVAELAAGGRTWGKRRVGIRTVSITGHGLTAGSSLLRNLARLVDEIPLLWLIPLLSQAHRRIGDRLADTIVVEDDGAKKPGARRHARPTRRALACEDGERRFHFGASAASRLYPDDLNLLEHLEDRLADMSSARADEAVTEVARRYADRLQLAEKADAIDAAPRRFLGELLAFLRERYDEAAG